MSGASVAGFMVDGFGPVVHTYTTGTSLTETVPVGASNVAIELWGAGAGGTRDHLGFTLNGAASGAYVKHVIATSGGSTFTYSVGAGGVGKSGTDGAGTNGAASTIVSPVLSAGGGVSNTAGGTASGGNTANINGNADTTLSDAGQAAPNGGANSGTSLATGIAPTGNPPGGGGTGNVNTGTATTTAGGYGASGQITFTYT